MRFFSNHKDHDKDITTCCTTTSSKTTKNNNVVVERQEQAPAVPVAVVPTSTTDSSYSFFYCCCNDHGCHDYRKRFITELKPCQPWFDIHDEVINNEQTLLDIMGSFAPNSWKVIIWKIIFVIFSIFTIVFCHILGDEPKHFFIFFTHWGLLFCIIYAILSLYNTIWRCVLVDNTTTTTTTTRVNVQFRITWILFEIAAQFSLVASGLFWIVVYDPSYTDMEFHTTTPHGPLLILVLIDGMIVNRIPIRLQHFLLIESCGLLYIFWSIIHDITHIGNGYREKLFPDTDDEYIYEILDWNNDVPTAIFWSFMSCFVVSPICYIILWMLSTGVFCCCCNNRRYVIENGDNNNENNNSNNNIDESDGNTNGHSHNDNIDIELQSNEE